MGHEFCGEVVELGPDTTGPAVRESRGFGAGVAVVDGSAPVGVQQRLSRGLRRVHAAFRAARPRGPQRARHAPRRVDRAPGGRDPRRGRARGSPPDDAAVVVGCGPVGLAVIAALRAVGVECIVAADFSPTRRAMARTLGAAEVVDPNEEGLVDAWRRVDGRRPLVAFEAVGVPGMIQQLLQRRAPRHAGRCGRGVHGARPRSCPSSPSPRSCRCTSPWRTAPDEFAGALRAMAEGEIDASPMITGSVDLDGVPGAFEDLARPDEHVKILVEPCGDVTARPPTRRWFGTRLAVVKYVVRAGAGRPGVVGAHWSHAANWRGRRRISPTCAGGGWRCRSSPRLGPCVAFALVQKRLLERGRGGDVDEPPDRRHRRVDGHRQLDARRPARLGGVRLPPVPAPGRRRGAGRLDPGGGVRGGIGHPGAGRRRRGGGGGRRRGGARPGRA